LFSYCGGPCLVLSCFFRVHPLGGLFLAHAEAGLHCTMQSITPPWAGCSALMHLNHLGALCGSYTCIARPRPYVAHGRPRRELDSQGRTPRTSVTVARKGHYRFQPFHQTLVKLLLTVAGGFCVEVCCACMGLLKTPTTNSSAPPA